MNSNYTCKFETHEGKRILGFCLNSQCQNPPFCVSCYKEKHKEHQNDCIQFQRLNKLFGNSLNSLEKVETQLHEQFDKSLRQQNTLQKIIKGNQELLQSDTTKPIDERFYFLIPKMKIIKKLYQDSQFDMDKKYEQISR